MMRVRGWRDSIDGDETCFVMVAPETLAMHHLYVIKSNVDLTGERGIDGYWRSASRGGFH